MKLTITLAPAGAIRLLEIAKITGRTPENLAAEAVEVATADYLEERLKTRDALNEGLQPRSGWLTAKAG